MTRKKQDKPTRRRKAVKKQPAQKRPPRRRGRLLWRLTVWSLVLAIWAVVAGTAVLAFYAYDLPEIGEIEQMARRPNITVLSRDGTKLASFGDTYGEVMSVAVLPPHLPRAVIAIEDRRFYRHPGIDIWGLLRATVANLQAGRIVQGGSTITQQLAKNLFLSPERTIKRKVQEVLFALWLERKFTKDQILSLYLNRVFLGAGSFGIDAAARHYFGKPATAVNLYEAALLAGLLKAPSRYNPIRDADRSNRRAGLVLQAMVDAEFITWDEAAKAMKEKSRGQVATRNQALYFIDWVLPQLKDFVGRFDQDLTVVTTLDAKLQKIAEEELTAALDKQGKKKRVSQAAAVVLSPDGAVRAMVGGHDYGKSQFNRATQALRQPGSAFKAFVFLAGVENGLTPDSNFKDAPVRVAKWSPRNYGGKYFGNVTLREAFARSLNSVAVRVSERVGRKKVAATARRLGITSNLEATPSIALGASEVTLLELTGAYAVFANKGHGVWTHGITEIRNGSGQILYRREGGGPGRVVAPRAVDDMTNLMTATVEWGTGKAAKPGRPAAGKTGTSQEFRDAWFMGFTTELVAGVWFGNDDGTPMNRVTGGSMPARLWQKIMVRALEGAAPQPLPGGGPPEEETGGDNFIKRILRRLGSGDDIQNGNTRKSPDGIGGPQR